MVILQLKFSFIKSISLHHKMIQKSKLAYTKRNSSCLGCTWYYQSMMYVQIFILPCVQNYHSNQFIAFEKMQK